MNSTPNLPEPTYNFDKVFASFQNTKKLLKSMVLLTKKLLML
jgi:hypothetical protein